MEKMKFLKKTTVLDLLATKTMKSSELVKWALCTLLLCASFSTKAQVTVGSQTEPAAGALLDLKNLATPGTNNSSADKGLLLPRVNLQSQTSLLPMSGDPSTHVGLTVYNVNPAAANLSVGQYIWNGTKWEKSGGTELQTITIPNNTLLILNSDIVSVINPATSTAVASVVLPTTDVEVGRVLYITNLSPSLGGYQVDLKKSNGADIDNNDVINPNLGAGAPSNTVGPLTTNAYLYLGGGRWLFLGRLR
jgi:hypothetical protein